MWDALGYLGACALFIAVVILLVTGMVRFMVWYEGYAERHGIQFRDEVDDDDDDGPLDTWWQAPPPTFCP